MDPYGFLWGYNEDEADLTGFVSSSIPSIYTQIKSVADDMLWVDEITFSAWDMKDAIKVVDEAKEKRNIEHVPSEITETSHRLYTVKIFYDDEEDSLG